MENLVGNRLLADTLKPISNWVDKYIPKAARQVVFKHTQNAINTKSPFELEHQVFSADGDIGWVHSKAIPSLNQNGEIVEWFGAGTDITERKHTEAALRNSEEKYRALFNSIDECFCIIQMIFDEHANPVDYLVLEANPALYQLTGLTNAVGKTMRELAPAHEQFWYDKYGEIAMTGVPARFQHQADALSRWYDVYAFPTGESQEMKVAVVFRDITECKNQEQHQSFLIKLIDELRLWVSANDIKVAAMRVLGEHLGVSRAQYHAVDESGEFYSADGVGYASGLPGIGLSFIRSKIKLLNGSVEIQ